MKDINLVKQLQKQIITQGDLYRTACFNSSALGDDDHYGEIKNGDINSFIKNGLPVKDK